jgi:hypothetical protein
MFTSITPVKQMVCDGQAQIDEHAKHAWYDVNAAQPMQLLYA